jgi:hypothetical protein
MCLFANCPRIWSSQICCLLEYVDVPMYHPIQELWQRPTQWRQVYIILIYWVTPHETVTYHHIIIYHTTYDPTHCFCWVNHACWKKQANPLIYIYTNIKNIKIQHLVLPSISLHISTCCRWDKCPHFCETALARSSWPPWPRPMRHRVLWVAHPSGYSWDRSWSHRAWRVTWARRGVARLGGFLRWKMLVLLGKD